MKAMVYHNYGSPDVLEPKEIEKPAAKDDEVLVKVHAASVNWHDWHFLTGTPFMVRLMAGLLKPKNKVLGIDVAGRVEAVGANVTQFQHTCRPNMSKSPEIVRSIHRLYVSAKTIKISCSGAAMEDAAGRPRGCGPGGGQRRPANLYIRFSSGCRFAARAASARCRPLA